MFTIRTEQLDTLAEQNRAAVVAQHRDLLLRHRPEAANAAAEVLERVLRTWHAEALAFGFTASSDVYLYTLVCFDRGPAFRQDPMIAKILGRDTVTPLVRLDAALVWANQHGIGGPTYGVASLQ